MNKSYIYFIRDNMTQLIKIGQSSKPNLRLANLKQETGHDLEILCTIAQPVPIEALLHFKFAHLWQHGEWFRAGDDLLELIEIYSGRADKCECGTRITYTYDGVFLDDMEVADVLFGDLDHDS